MRSRPQRPVDAGSYLERSNPRFAEHASVNRVAKTLDQNRATSAAWVASPNHCSSSAVGFAKMGRQ